jgi:hypothetical protein
MYKLKGTLTLPNPQKTGSLDYKTFWTIINVTARFKNVSNCLNTNISFYLDTSGGQNSNLYLNVVPFFDPSVN